MMTHGVYDCGIFIAVTMRKNSEEIVGTIIPMIVTISYISIIIQQLLF